MAIHVTGPWISHTSFFTRGQSSVIALSAASYTLTEEAHAGRLLEVTGAGTDITLPTIVDSTDNLACNVGCVYRFFFNVISTTNTVITDGTDKFWGAVAAADGDNISSAVWTTAGNDIFTLNGGTQGGEAKGTYIECTAVNTAIYMVTGFVVNQNADPISPFSG